MHKLLFQLCICTVVVNVESNLWEILSCIRIGSLIIIIDLVNLLIDIM